MKKNTLLIISSVLAIIIGGGILNVVTTAVAKINKTDAIELPKEDSKLVAIEKPIISHKVSPTQNPLEIPQKQRIMQTTENRIDDVKKNGCESPTTPTEDWWLNPINRVNSLGSYVPNNLSDIRGNIQTLGNKFICLTDTTNNALEELINAIESAQLKIIAISGFRSRSYQKRLFDAWRSRFTTTPPYFAVAEPEHSEHQLGTTIDFMSGTQVNADFEKFGESLEYVWMKDHAYEYGFVQSYEKGKEEITGYIGEAWHWRYVGVPIATAIKEQNISLTEYLAENK